MCDGWEDIYTGNEEAMKEASAAISDRLNSLVSKRIRKDWMMLDQEQVDGLDADDWEHYKGGGCLCFAYSDDELDGHNKMVSGGALNLD